MTKSMRSGCSSRSLPNTMPRLQVVDAPKSVRSIGATLPEMGPRQLEAIIALNATSPHLTGISMPQWEVEDSSADSPPPASEEGEEEFTYEELTALGEVAGTVSRGLSAKAMASLPVLTWERAASSAGVPLDNLCVVEEGLARCACLTVSSCL